jgi:uncharacterized repeat protein (TIGR01451 family)
LLESGTCIMNNVRNIDRVGVPERRWNDIPLIVRATFNATGAITFTGNTLGLSRSDVSGVPGTLDSIGAFTTTNTAIRYGSYPFGTTDNYLLNSSSAQLALPAGSSILYAELIWGASYINGTVNLSSVINNAITFATPTGSFTVSPDSTTSNDIDLGNGVSAYVRSANVTSIIQSGGAGTYTTGRVPSTITVNNDPTGNHAGWTLGVIYQNPSLPFRNMSLRAGAVLIQADSSAVTTTLTGFSTPVSGALGGRALFSAQEGDANRNGDQALFGPTTSNLVALSGTNNFATNFFASQINNDSGALDTTGTFGTRNQTNGAPGTNISGGRQGWDITNVDISSRLVNNQTTAVLRLTTSGDAYVLNANAIQVNINAPLVTVSKAANVTGALVGDTIRYTVTSTNTGTADATGAILTDALPAGSTFIAGSVTVGGVPRPTNDITAGVPLGTISPGGSIVVAYSVRVTSMPSGQRLVNVANLSFSFQSVSGGPITNAIIPSNAVTIPVYSPLLTLTKSANTGNALVGTTVTYTLVASNTGNIASAVTVSDPIPAGTTFVPNSVTVNGSTVPGGNIVTGVSAGTIAVGGSSTVTFQVLVQSVPSPPQLTNQGSSLGTFQVPDGRTSSQSVVSNQVQVPVALPNVTAVKSASFTDVTVGDTITYSVVVTNSSAGSVTDVVVQDALPAGSQFVTGSVTVRGATVPAASPSSGISVGTLAAGTSATVTFKALVASVPSSGSLVNQSNVAFRSGAFNSIVLTNTVTIPVYQPVISTTKFVNATIATVGSTLTYSLSVTNSGNIAAQGTLTDPLPSSVTFVPGSVYVNTVNLPGASPIAGIPLGTIAPGSTVPVTFQIVVNAVPPSSRLVNRSTTGYSYQLPGGRSFTGLVSLSNTVDIPVTSPQVAVTKSVNTAIAILNDVLTYTSVVANNGVQGITGVVFSDVIPSGLTFVSGSVTINGAAAPIANPATGISLGSIAAGASVTVVFRASVDSVPLTIPAIVSNRSNASFTSGAFNGTASSALVNTQILQPVIGIAKSSSVQSITVGGTFSYTLTANNAGNYPADVMLFDIIPPSMSFVPNSVVINGFPNPGVAPSTGIPLDTLSAGETNVVSFSVAVVSLPSPQQTENQAQAAFQSTLPNGRVLTGSVLSNTAKVAVFAPDVEVVKSASVPTAVRGDSFVYTVFVTNEGTETINEVVLLDSLQAGLMFVPGTATVNGATRPNADPAAGIPIGSIASGASVTVTFEVMVNMADPTPIINQSTVSFTSGAFASSSWSNVVVTPVTQPVITLAKSASTSNATLGDSVVYSIVVSNTGNVAANLTLTDPIPAGTIFTPNSVVIGGVPLPGADPSAGIALGSVAPGTSVTVTFNVVVDSLPTPQQLRNQATAAFTFIPPDGRTLSGSAVSNTLVIPVSAPNVTLVKNSATTNTTIGDTIPFSVVVTNSGIEAVNNVIFVDPVPAGTSFVTGSVTLNTVPAPTAVPSNGINLGSIPAGGSVTVTFNVTVTSVPNGGSIANRASANFTSGAFSGISFSNTLTIPVNQPSVTGVKSSSVTSATVGDTINFTVVATNTGNYPGTATLTDIVPAGASFVENSVVIGGVPLPGASPVTGIPLGLIQPGNSVTTSFSVLIESLPTPPQLSNQATLNTSYTLPDGRSFSNQTLTNTVVVAVRAPNVNVGKATTTTATTIGDTIEYRVTVTNEGITSISNTILTDPIPAGTTFVTGSVTVGGAPVPGANPATGVALGTIAPGTTVPVTFQVTVGSVPTGQLVSNQAFVSFTSGSLSATSFSPIITTPVYVPGVTLVKSANTPGAIVGDTVVYSTAITNTGNIGANTTFSDAIPAGAVLVPNSVIFNGSSLAGADPGAGIPLGVLAPGSTSSLSFSVVITSQPPTNQLSNQSNASFSYTLSDGRTFNGSAASNVVVTPVSSPDVSLVKSTTFTAATVGDIVPYTVVITNSGAGSVTNVTFFDPVPSFTTFVSGSVTVNDTAVPGANPALGVTIGTIASGASATVTFNVTVNSLPPSGQIVNQSSAAYTSGAFSATSFSNQLSLPAYQALINVVKSANVTVATVGDTITYLLNVTNTGDIDALVTLSDPLPDGAEFVPNSVIINGAPQPGVNPETGIPLGVVPAGGVLTVAVTLQVTVEALPSPQQLANTATASYSYTLPDGRVITGSVNSNTLVIPVSAPDVTVVKSTPAIDAVSGDIITYTVVVSNNGIETVNNVVLVDPIPPGSTFVAGSVTLDDASLPLANPANGITIGSIAAGTDATVTFQVQVL